MNEDKESILSMGIQNNAASELQIRNLVSSTSISQE